jgi:uncharacterized protein
LTFWGFRDGSLLVNRAATIAGVPALNPWEIGGIFGAGVVAGAVNTVVGSGSLLTFPTLLAFGYSPLVANVSNTLGLVPGAASGAVGYRRELTGQRTRIRRLGVISIAGGLLGAGLLLALPSSSFERVVPYLVLVACALVVVQPRLSARMIRQAALRPPRERPHRGLDVGVFLTGIYGGYFGAAQGVILIALLGIFVDDHVQRLNALKNVVIAMVNGVAALLFVFFAPVAYLPAALLAIGSAIGGQIGATVGRRLAPNLLRLLIVLVGTGVAIKLFVSP